MSENKGVYELCKNCGKKVIFYYSNNIDVIQCECGTAIINPIFNTKIKATSYKTNCKYCSDTGLILIPVSGRYLYTTVARCQCGKGDELSEKIPLVPDSFFNMTGKEHNSYFTKRRENIINGINNYIQEVIYGTTINKEV